MAEELRLHATLYNFIEEKKKTSFFLSPPPQWDCCKNNKRGTFLKKKLRMLEVKENVSSSFLF
ncbi:hypothetical protein [Escherichia coli]|uniref:hypothetical protein n=1 Tax=Escherichia coli TaxID=562 RepID=UPI0030D5EF58